LSAICMIVFIIGFAVGYGFGFIAGGQAILGWSIDKTISFLEIQGIELNISGSHLRQAIWNYRQNIDRCFDRQEGFDNWGPT